MRITIFTTGGTIDKVYFDAKSEFHVGDSEIPEFLRVASVVLLPAALWHDGWTLAAVSPRSWGGLIYLAVFSSALAYLLYYRVLETAGAGNLSLVTILIVPVAVVLGALVYQEALPPRAGMMPAGP